MNPAMRGIPKKEATRLLALERKYRATGAWGPWETLNFPPCTVGPDGWTATITTAHKNRVFSVLDRMDATGIRHLAVTSLSEIRPTWPEMQRIKSELAGPEATAIEVYPPDHQIVDDANMYHLWVLRGNLPFGLHIDTRGIGLRSPIKVLA